MTITVTLIITVDLTIIVHLSSAKVAVLTFVFTLAVPIDLTTMVNID